MPYVFLIVFGLVVFVPEWRRTALIIFIAAFANVLYAPIVDAAAALGDQRATIAHVFADFITILALLKWGSRGKFTARNIFKKAGGAKFLQAGILTAFMTWNLALLLDYKSSPYPIYESYSQVIFALNIVQILFISGGIYAGANSILEGVRQRHYRHFPHNPRGRKHMDGLS